MTLREIDRARLIVMVFDACKSIVEGIYAKKKRIDTEQKRFPQSISELDFIMNFSTIMNYPELVVDDWLDLLDGNIQRLIPSNVDEMFLIGYEILVSKGVIIRT